jgi:hypothetical protein
MGAKSKGTQTTQQKTEPWDAQKPYLTKGFAEAERLYDSSKPEYYPGDTLAAQGANTQAGLASTGQGIQGGTQGILDAQNVAQNTARGDYLNNNPYIDATFNKAADAVTRQFRTGTTPGVDSNAALQGMYGSGAHQWQRETADRAYGDTLGNLATDIYGGNYNNERNRQMTAVGNAPQTFGMGLIPGQAQAGLGQQQDARSQQEIDDARARFDYNQNLDANKLARYQQMVQGNYGGTQTTTQPVYGNPLAGLLGAGLGIAGMASGMPGLGGLSGLFGGWGGGGASNQMAKGF